MKDLRRTRKLTQSALAELVNVGKGTIERLERGDDQVSVRTVFRVLEVLGASPQHYYELAMYPSLMVAEIHARDGLLHGLHTYVRVLCERTQLALPALAEAMRIPPTTLSAWVGADTPAPLPALALLLALIHLDVPLTDLAPIVHATDDPAAQARQCAVTRGTLITRLREVNAQAPPAADSPLAIDAILGRLTALLQQYLTLPQIVRNELFRICVDLERYRVLLSLAIRSIEGAP